MAAKYFFHSEGLICCLDNINNRCVFLFCVFFYYIVNYCCCVVMMIGLIIDDFVP